MNGVSIIVCCYNSAERIGATLKHLQLQQFNSSILWEVIVVDNASTDSTTDTSKKIWNQAPVTDLFVFHEEKPGLMNARNRGFLEARYEIISFIDDDNWVENRWVQKVYDLFKQHDKMGACGGRNEAVFEGEPPEWFGQFQNSFAVGKQASKSGIIDNGQDYLWGAGVSFRRSIWEELQKRKHINLTADRTGNSLSSGGDTELCYAFRLMGYQLYYEDTLSLKHYMPMARMQFPYVEKLYEGFGKANVRLNCYKVLLNPDTFKLFPWWYEYLAAIKKSITDSFVSRWARDKKKRWEAKTQKAYWKGYAKQMWEDRNALKQYIAALRSVFGR